MSTRLYWEIGKRAFQRQLAYRTANLAGLFTNACFGYLRGSVFIALYQTERSIGGYDVSAAVTFTWVTQALIMVVFLWGWWDVEETIRTGDVVSDLAKPFSYLGFWLARDYGRALYHLLFRCCPILLIGEVMFGLRWPTSPVTWAALALSLTLAVAISFAWRFTLNLTAFWTTDARGIGGLASILSTLLCGLLVPLPYFPDTVRRVVEALPFAGILQIPADVFLERVTGAGLLLALGQQALWAGVMLGATQLLVMAATRRVVVQGG
ncbi:MAG: ABC-2 family transporter protein [Chloroflexi bacterium]|nr:ABC-2 family transporter protein [Chloroflexota bacterium]